MELTAYKDFDINNEFIVIPFHHYSIYVQFAKLNYCLNYSMLFPNSLKMIGLSDLLIFVYKDIDVNDYRLSFH